MASLESHGVDPRDGAVALMQQARFDLDELAKLVKRLRLAPSGQSEPWFSNESCNGELRLALSVP